MQVTITPIDSRAVVVCEKHGYKFDVMAVDKERILLRSLDGEWQGVFAKSEAEWPDNILEA